MSSANRERLTSSFINSIPLVCIPMLGGSGTILNSRGDSRHPCLVLKLSAKDSNLPPFNMKLAMCFPYTVLIVSGNDPCIPNLNKIFSMKGCF